MSATKQQKVEAMLPDLEIANRADVLPIASIAAKLEIPPDALIPYGHDKAKISYQFLDTLQDKPNGKLILVTAVSPTPAGEGKTTTTVGLGDGLNALDKDTIICLREPSLGPCFGMKGGAAGGGFPRLSPCQISTCTLRAIFMPSARLITCWQHCWTITFTGTTN
jgi:formate--tetrahydrofolate ligase